MNTAVAPALAESPQPGTADRMAFSVFLAAAVHALILFGIGFVAPELLDPKMFFRINRQFIINISSIVKMSPASKSRLALTLKPAHRHETITSNERTADFRKWLMGVL